MAEQFQVPQFIEREPRLIGPLTIKQTITLGIGGAILAVLWFFLEKVFFFPTAFAVGGLFAAIAFVKINGRPMFGFLGSFFSYFSSPQLYIWQKDRRTESTKEKFIKSKRKKGSSAEKTNENDNLTRKKIESIAKQLNQ